MINHRFKILFFSIFVEVAIVIAAKLNSNFKEFFILFGIIFLVFLAFYVLITIKSKRQNTFFAGLIHDLKTPNIAQIKALDLLLDNAFGALNDEQKEIIFEIKNSCNYMNKLIFTILNTFVFEEKKNNLNIEKINIKHLIEEVIGETGHLARERGQNIIVSSDISQEFLYGDKLQLKRVITNLVGNAISYGLENSNILITLKDWGENVSFDIENKSRFYEKKEIKEMFKKYKTTEKGKYIAQGTGLGLYLAKKIIDRHKGRIYAKSKENGLCVFGFNIPKKVKNGSFSNFSFSSK